MPYLSREWQLYWEDMLEASRRVVRYTRGLDADTFARDDMIRDAVLRNLEVIGETAKRLPMDVRNSHPNIEWRRIAGFRDVIAHAYFGIHPAILWDIVANKIPALLRQMEDEA